MFLAKIVITLKPTVNDPQGITIGSGLRDLGYTAVESVRAGKYMEVQIADNDPDSAARQVSEMCDKLLANPIIENLRFELEPVGSS